MQWMGFLGGDSNLIKQYYHSMWHNRQKSMLCLLLKLVILNLPKKDTVRSKCQHLLVLINTIEQDTESIGILWEKNRWKYFSTSIFKEVSITLTQELKKKYSTRKLQTKKTTKRKLQTNIFHEHSHINPYSKLNKKRSKKDIPS